MRLLGHDESGWTPPVLTCSGLTGAGLAEVWDALDRHLAHLRNSGGLTRRQQQQRVDWMWATVRDELDRRLHESPAVRELAGELTEQVRTAQISPVHAADRIVAEFLDG
jgi:LAO/AO transport system kinase